MGAPAVATPKRARTAPKRRPPAHRSRSGKQRSGNVVRFPVNAVGDLADSGVVVGISRGRAWIFVVGILLCGIVAVNVLGLSLSAAGSETALKIDDLQRENSVLRGRTANRLSNDKVSAVAARLGLAVPAAGDVGYLDAGRRDVEEAARRLAAGEIALASPVASVPLEDELAPAVDPVSGEPLAAPVEPDPVPVEPAAPAVETATGVDPTAAGGTPVP